MTGFGRNNTLHSNSRGDSKVTNKKTYGMEGSDGVFKNYWPADDTTDVDETTQN
jgi:hypothetical protein